MSFLLLAYALSRGARAFTTINTSWRFSGAIITCQFPYFCLVWKLKGGKNLSLLHLKKKKYTGTYIYVHIYMHTGTYIYVHIHTHIYISGALAQLTLKNYTSNRLREDNKLNVCLLPQWMHRASVLRPQGSEEDWEHEECDHLFY